MADQIINPVLPSTRTPDPLKKKKPVKNSPTRPATQDKKPDDKKGIIDTYA